MKQTPQTTTKAKRYPLEFGGESSTSWSGQPIPEAKGGYDFDPKASYEILFRDEPAGDGKVERDASGRLWVTPSFEISFEEVKFHAFWQREEDKAVLSRIVMLAREFPTQPWV